MIDKDGVKRPDSPDGNILQIKNETRKVKFDESYPFRPRNIFFRIWAAIFRAVAIAVFNPFMVLKYKMTTTGGKTLKKLRKKGFIVTVNHVHMFDDLSIGTNLFCWRKIYFTTLDRNIKRPMIGFFLRSLGGIPIPANSISGMKKFNEDVSYLLKHNKPVLYNPEAALWPYYRGVRPFKRGAFSMAVKNDVPVVPMAITFKRKQKRNGKFKYKLFFTIGDAIEIDKTLDEKAASEKMMRQACDFTVSTIKNFYESQDCGFGDESSGFQVENRPN